MKKREPGYLTQCDKSDTRNWNAAKMIYERTCQATKRLSKPGTWRCDECAKLFGKLVPK